MNKNTLTAKQQETYSFIKGFIAQKGESPTITEIGDGLGLKSLRSVTQRIESLEAKGLIKRDSFKHRGISLIKESPYSSGTVQVPVIASAGCDAAEVYAEERYDEYLLVDKKLTGDRASIAAIKAVGNSMIDAGIHNGDYVLVEVTENVSSGDRVVALLDDKAVIKKLRIAPGVTILEPESAGNGYSPIVMSGENTRIFGKVLSVIPMSDPDDYQVIYEPGEKRN